MVDPLEWKENDTSNSGTHKSIIKLLTNQMKLNFGQEKLLFFMSPEPARNIDLLCNEINRLKLINIKEKNKIEEVRFGYKDRSWGIVFQDADLLDALIPLLFNHGSELLAIAAIKESEKTMPDILPLILNSIMFNENTDQFQSEYTGLYFECGQLVEKL